MQLRYLQRLKNQHDLRGHYVRDTVETVTFNLMLILKAPETVHKRLTVSVALQHYTWGAIYFLQQFCLLMLPVQCSSQNCKSH
ncbi:hypothetical protein [Leptolyngbya sp. FACHB-321]|uniref:hypothetical protein n=1 Tax=Leptolyngbya sp. FACHB-321 TaxID=2692807 RepID=UPI001689B16F|nr:hypothetical protein [Leptolyngbya sp. FACHB-321]